ncbi:MAG: DUF3320 domain-containing protein [Alphaproteobacteria bacterium]|nr:DUF3320 domain-containing protein [Alphaproteobacteria bacterium]MCW5743427.1 DUF3320 domain-containing protein [Alphaproteobacteria bacterium]
MESSIAARLDAARRDLLDLSTRNRLLSIPADPRARLVRMRDERSADIYRLLVKEKRDLVFVADPLAPAKASAARPDAAEPADGDASDATETQPAPRAEPDESAFTDENLQTTLDAKALEKRLLDLRDEALTLLEEQGVNILYLALGQLKWREAAGAMEDRFAPLLLVPVTLQRRSARSRFTARWDETDPGINLSLVAKLKSEFALDLPDADEAEDLDVAAWFRRVAEAVSGMPGWEVRPDAIVLGVFSFAKFLMYRDLDPANWPDDRRIDRHEKVASLLLGRPLTTEASVDLPSDDTPIDDVIAPATTFHVVDADSSQTVAIEAARRGVDLVIQGPPGTGKSQTIINILTALVADGRSVLFVAEKRAALEVVKRRMDQAGLGALCLELHSNKASKRAIIDELRATLELGAPKNTQDDDLIRGLSGLRTTLNAHARAANEPVGASGWSAHEIYGRLLRPQAPLAASPRPRLPGCEAWTQADAGERREALASLCRLIAGIGLPSRHPWRETRCEPLLPMDYERIGDLARAAADRLAAVGSQAGAIAASMQQPPPTTLGDVSGLLAMARHALAAPDLDAEAMHSPAWSRDLGRIRDLVETGTRHAEAQAGLADRVVEAAWSVDLSAARVSIASHGASWLRFLNGGYRQSMRLVRSVLKVDAPSSLGDRLRLIDDISSARRDLNTLRDSDALGREALAARWRREHTDWSVARAWLGWVEAGRSLSLPDELRMIAARLVGKSQLGTDTERLASDLADLLERLRALMGEVGFDAPAGLGSEDPDRWSIEDLGARLAGWGDRPKRINEWVGYRREAGRANDLSLEEFVAALWDGRLESTHALDAFESTYCEALCRQAWVARPELASFDGDRHHDVVARFAMADRSRIALARRQVAAAHHARVPRTETAFGGLRHVRYEIAKKRGHMPLRKLTALAGSALQAIKPVFMMSPLSIAQFLEPGRIDFDVVIFDEASQVTPVDSLGALARARQFVVVGDSRQLPPTRFFQRVGQNDVDDFDDETAPLANIESILELCKASGVAERMLRWHYRSRHHSLIAVSNREFYDSRLFIVPSPWTSESGLGLAFHHLPEAVYDRGGTRSNAIEAKVVAQAVIQHARNNPGLTLGVAAFSQPQRQAIVDQLELARKANTDVETFFNDHPHEPFFVKNLENVQGDERDVIFLSVGYGRDASGYFAGSIPTLNTDGGDRRLNVLISRARRRCEVFSSVTDEDFDPERIRTAGMAALRVFLRFARTGDFGVASVGERPPDSPFEEAVMGALAARGYQVRAQVGVAGFFIDLAVVDPQRPGRYVLGIECDGASYHSARSARDRDRLRQTVLEDHGWHLHRIWSTDWFRDPARQIERAVAAIEAARRELADMGEEEGEAEPTTQDLLAAATLPREATPVEAPAGKVSTPYRESTLAAPGTFGAILDADPADLRKAVVSVVEQEGPIHEDDVVTRLRTSWGAKRSGPRIQAAVTTAIKGALRAGQVSGEGRFLLPVQWTPACRDRSGVSLASLRKAESIPPMEVDHAIIALVRANHGLLDEEVPRAVARTLGITLTSSVRALVDQRTRELIRAGRLVVRDEMIVATDRNAAAAN